MKKIQESISGLGFAITVGLTGISRAAIFAAIEADKDTLALKALGEKPPNDWYQFGAYERQLIIRDAARGRK